MIFTLIHNVENFTDPGGLLTLQAKFNSRVLLGNATLPR